MKTFARYTFVWVVSGWAGIAVLSAHADLQGSCLVSFSGTSTLHDFEGHAVSEPFSVTPRDDGVYEMDISVPLITMTTDHDKRDAKMLRSLEADAFPAIKGTVTVAVPQDENAVSRMVLELHGHKEPVEFTVKNWQETGGRISFDGEFALAMSAFDIHVPSVLGVIRVGDEVMVSAHVEMDAGEVVR